MMLDFWYSERCTREIKLAAAIISCAVIYYCAGIAKLSPGSTLICLGLGAALHLFRMLLLKYQASHPTAAGMTGVFYAAGICCLAIPLQLLPKQHQFIYGIQAYGFIWIGLLICCILQTRAKRFE